MENENYKIVKDKTVFGLQYAVNELVQEGWEPQGGLVIENGDYIQTMVKKEKPVLVEETLE